MNIVSDKFSVIKRLLVINIKQFKIKYFTHVRISMQIQTYSHTDLRSNKIIRVMISTWILSSMCAYKWLSTKKAHVVILIMCAYWYVKLLFILFVRMSMLVSMTLASVVISCMISVALIKSPEILVPIDLKLLIFCRIIVYNNPYTA